MIDYIDFIEMFAGVAGFRYGLEKTNQNLSRISEGKIQDRNGEHNSNFSEEDGRGGKQHPLCRSEVGIDSQQGLGNEEEWVESRLEGRGRGQLKEFRCGGEKANQGIYSGREHRRQDLQMEHQPNTKKSENDLQQESGFRSVRSNDSRQDDGTHPHLRQGGEENIRSPQDLRGRGNHPNAEAPHSFRCVWANDNDKYASQIYRKNFGGKELVEADIYSIDNDSIPDHNLLTAGFPCPSFSVAGQRMGFEDPRGKLFDEILRVARAKRPKILLLENVAGLLSAKAQIGTGIYKATHGIHGVDWKPPNWDSDTPSEAEKLAGTYEGETPIDEGTGELTLDHRRVEDEPERGWKEVTTAVGAGYCFYRILESLQEMGDTWVEWETLNSKKHGVPQNRERVFIIGHLGGRGGREVFPIFPDDGVVAKTQGASRRTGSRLRVANPLGVGGSFKERNLIANTLSKRYYKDGSENLIQTDIHQLNNPTHSYYRVYGTDGIAPSQRSHGGNKAPKIVADRSRTLAGKGRNLESPKETTNALSSVQKDNLLILSHSPHTNDPKLGGAGPLLSDEHCFTIDSTPHKVILPQAQTRDPLVMRWKRTEEGKKVRSRMQREHGKDYTPFGKEYRELVPSDEDEIGCLTNAVNKDTLMSVANTVTPDAYLARGERKRVDGKAVLTSMFERRIRRLTPVECERLQGFPDSWTERGLADTPEQAFRLNRLFVGRWLRKRFPKDSPDNPWFHIAKRYWFRGINSLKPLEFLMSDTSRYKCLGNAVTTNVITFLGERILERCF